MIDSRQRSAAKQFAADWAGKGYEKGQSQVFWLSLLQKVYGVSEPDKFITFEDQIMLDHTSFIDGFIASTHVLIEQKELDRDLRKPIKQSDGSLLSPFQQADLRAGDGGVDNVGSIDGSQADFGIGISPVALNESELQFVKALHKYITSHPADFESKEVYLIRNRSKKGIGFFDDTGFFPDFILWVIVNGKQYITFIDPHGMARESITSSKVGLFKRLKDEIESTLPDKSVALTSFILSPTKYSDPSDKSPSIAEWNGHHVFFLWMMAIM